MRAFDFRFAARKALAGKWPLAILTGLIALMLNGISNGTPEFKVNFNTHHGATATVNGIDLGLLGEHGLSFGAGALFAWLTSIAFFALLLSIVWYILGSVIALGYARFNLDLAAGGDARMESLFSYFSWFKTAVCARLWVTLFTLLWSLLFIIPGIIAGYSYAMTPYILAEHPDLPAREAVAQSKAMMAGNRWRLFCLELSFIGWDILCLFTLGIGHLVLTPYKQAATAVFYQELTGRRTRDPWAF